MKHSYNRSFPPPISLLMSSFALDISDQSIKYGELVYTNDGLSLGRYGQEMIPAGVILSGKIQDEKKLVDVLKKLKTKENLNFIRAALPEEQMYLFTLALPKMENSGIYDAILLQLEDHVPVKAQDSVFAYNIISNNNNGILVEVSVASSSTVDSYMSAFEQADIVPLSFELEAQAITRAIVDYADTTTCMIVDFGKARTGVSIACSGKVFFTTTVDFGGNELTNRIASSFGISFEQAEDLKKSYGINSKNTNDKIFESMLSGLALLKDELNKHCTYWKTHDISGAAHDQIDRIILCGGDSNLQGLANYLESQIKIKVVNANSWINISDFSISVPKMSFEQSLLYSTVIGLALGDHIYGNSRIVNVLPQDKKDKIKLSYWLRLSTVFMYCLSFVFLFGSILLIPSYITSVFKEQEYEASLQSFNQNNKDLDINIMSKTITDINNKISILSKESVKNEIVEKVIGLLVENKPQGISFSSISYKQKDKDNITIEIAGKATERTALSLYKDKLNSDPSFKNVDIPISNFLERKDLPFNITLQLK